MRLPWISISMCNYITIILSLVPSAIIAKDLRVCANNSSYANISESRNYVVTHHNHDEDVHVRLLRCLTSWTQYALWVTNKILSVSLFGSIVFSLNFQLKNVHVFLPPQTLPQ